MAPEPSLSGERVVDLTRSGLLGDVTKALVTSRCPHAAHVILGHLFSDHLQCKAREEQVAEVGGLRPRLWKVPAALQVKHCPRALDP